MTREVAAACPVEVLDPRAAPSRCPPPAGLAAPPHDLEWLAVFLFGGIPHAVKNKTKQKTQPHSGESESLTSSLRYKCVPLSTSPPLLTQSNLLGFTLPYLFVHWRVTIHREDTEDAGVNRTHRDPPSDSNKGYDSF